MIVLKKVAKVVYKCSFIATFVVLLLRYADYFELLSPTTQRYAYFIGGNMIGKALTLFACIGIVRTFLYLAKKGNSY